jgi:DNA-binding Lrp family transcriptional regulator
MEFSTFDLQGRILSMLDIDTDVLLDLNEMGLTFKEQAEELGCSTTTISNRIAKIQAEQGILIKYRALQSLQLTSIQAKILEAITPEKINEAPLRDLVVAFKILKDKELVVDGKPSEIKGLVSYLIKMEKEELALTQAEEVLIEKDDVTDGSFEDPDYIPEL